MLTLTDTILARKRQARPRGSVRTDPLPGKSARVVIEYSFRGNHEPVARQLARAIDGEFGEDVALVPSRDGVFEVSVDGRLVFSKRASWRFPEHDEIFYHVGQR